MEGGAGRTAAADKRLGADRAFAEESRRLRNAAAECQQILDEQRVATTKRQAADKYVTEGKTGGLTKLTAATKGAVFDDEPSSEKTKDIRSASALLGLTPAETAAIYAFTNEDYKYINPATASKDKWLLPSTQAAAGKYPQWKVDVAPQGERKAPQGGFSPYRTKKRGQTDEALSKEENYQKAMTPFREEGSLHTAFAMSGLAKLPVWTGKVYRGEMLLQTRFDERFTRKESRSAKVTYGYKGSKTANEALVSSTKNPDVARGFWGISAQSLKPPNNSTVYVVFWEITLIQGRDIMALSANTLEEEIATLPGAEFRIDKVWHEPREKGMPGGGFDPSVKREGIIMVRATQVK